MMKGYFVGMISVIAMSGVMVGLAPKGGARRAIETLRGLCIVFVLLLGVLAVLDSAGDIAGEITQELELIFSEQSNGENYAEIYNYGIAHARAGFAKDEVKSLMVKDLARDAKDFDIDFYIEAKEENSDEFYIKTTYVTIYPSGVATDPREIEKWVSEHLKSRCEIIYRTTK